MRSRNKELSKTTFGHAAETQIGSIDARGIAPRPVPALTHERIAERAKALWEASGRVPGRDEQNWHEAEMQLRAELQAR